MNDLISLLNKKQLRSRGFKHFQTRLGLIMESPSHFNYLIGIAYRLLSMNPNFGNHFDLLSTAVFEFDLQRRNIHGNQ